MSDSKQYVGSYKDSKGSIPIIVENDFKTLSCEINGVRFYGNELSDLSVDNKLKYTDRQLERFTFFAIPIYNTNEVVQVLCDCSFSFVVPQTLVDAINNIDVNVEIEIGCFLAKRDPQMTNQHESDKYLLSLILNERKYYAKSDHIEDALLQIQNQFDHKYFFKNCFGCMYGDYSVYGSSAFGSMICYSNQKEEYKRVTDKDEYMNLDASNCERVQEIYCCEEFELRENGAGYRG